MKKQWISMGLAAVFVLTFASFASRADEDQILLGTKLSGFEEVLPKVTNGVGTFRARLSNGAIAYELTFSDLSTDVFAAHIHFAQRGVNGGIFTFLCGGGGQATCPAAGGTVTGTITPANILSLATPGPTDQGIAAGDFAAAVRAIRSGQTYVNVHSRRYPGGEVRGQVGITEKEGENR